MANLANNADKLSVVAGTLANTLKGEVKIIDIIETIKNISNFKSETLENIDLNPNLYKDNVYDDIKSGYIMAISDLWVDLTYQRTIRVQKLIKLLKSIGKFDESVAGHVDVAIRPDGRAFVWDGFRRTTMAGLVDGEAIKVSKFKDTRKSSNKECRITEAKMYKVRNSDYEKMKPEEIFKSKTVHGDEEALEILDTLKTSKLNILNLVPNGRSLGGFQHFEETWWKENLRHYLPDASQIIQKVQRWKNDSVSVNLLCGLAEFLHINDELSHPLSQIEILEYFENKDNRQNDIAKNRLSGKSRESIAFYIGNKVVKLNGSTKEFNQLIDLDSEQQEMLQNF